MDQLGPCAPSLAWVIITFWTDWMILDVASAMESETISPAPYRSNISERRARTSTWSPPGPGGHVAIDEGVSYKPIDNRELGSERLGEPSAARFDYCVRVIGDQPA
jgi:hypothetical protein